MSSNPPPQKPGRSKQDYCTPKPFLQAVKHLLDIEDFACDLAASKENTVGLSYYDLNYDSLKREGDWSHNGWCWLNPPFQNLKPWTYKAWSESQAGAKIAMLLPASVGSNWYRDYVDSKCFVFFLNGRLAFMPDKPKWLYPKDCMLCLYGLANVTGSKIWSW